MRAVEIRRRILEEHAELGRRLDEIEALAEEFERGSREVSKALRERGLALYTRFAAHLDLEDDILASALRAAGAFGEKAADQLAREHREQRELLGYLLSRLTQQGHPTILIARELQNFAGFLRHEMAHEEETMLTKGILHEPAGAEKE